MGRKRNGGFRLSKGNKQTFVHAEQDVGFAPIPVVRGPAPAPVSGRCSAK